MSIRRKSVIALLGVAGVLAAVLVSVAAAGSSSNGPPQTRVYGGGSIPAFSCSDGATTFCTVGVRELSILAIHDPNENVTYGTINIARGANPIEVVRVTCLAVSGNVAEVGGVVVQPTGAIGSPYELFVRDSGQPGAVSRDGVSPSFIGAPGDPKATCNDVSSNAFDDGFLTLANGDIAIQKITNQNG